LPVGVGYTRTYVPLRFGGRLAGVLLFLASFSGAVRRGKASMCQGLAELHDAMESYAAVFDAGLLSGVDARSALGHLTAIEHMASTLKALVAARVADVGGWRAEGQRSAAYGLARATGTSVGAAHQLLEVARRLESQPEVAAAARRGQLSAAQASAISDAAAADPAAGRGLVEHAAGGTLAELRDECARTKAAAEPDLEARRRRIHAARRLRAWTDPEGVWHLTACGNVEDGAQVMAALAPIRDQLFGLARRQDRPEPPDAYAFDALIQLAVEAASPQPVGGGPSGRPRRGAPLKLLLRVDYDTWLRGFPLPGETCELVGYGPVSMAAVHHLVEMGDPFVAAVLTKAKAVVGVAHLGRRPNAHQQTALEWLYPSCAARGCPVQGRLQADHRVDWAQTHFTTLDYLDLLCEHDHQLKTRYGWALVNGTGKRPFVPPDDPRHPRNQPQAGRRPTKPPPHTRK
jgi:Domain of unknown function (DUF222)